MVDFDDLSELTRFIDAACAKVGPGKTVALPLLRVAFSIRPVAHLSQLRSAGAGLNALKANSGRERRGQGALTHFDKCRIDAAWLAKLK